MSRPGSSGTGCGLLLLIGLVLNLSGCTDRDRSAPSLQGELYGDTYLAADGSFHVALPGLQDSYEHWHIPIQEQFQDGHAYVRFGPVGSNGSLYQVALGPIGEEDGYLIGFPEIASAAVAEMQQQIVGRDGGEFVERDHEEVTLSGLRAFRWSFLQSWPHRPDSGQSAVAEPVHHDAWVVDGGRVAALLWIQQPGSCSACGEAAEHFVQSFGFGGVSTSGP